MYKVIIKRVGAPGEIMEIMETDKMTSRDVYKSVLAAINWIAHIEKSCIDDIYDACVYKDGKFLYLLSLCDYCSLSKKWIGLTRASDLKTCVISG